MNRAFGFNAPNGACSTKFAGRSDAFWMTRRIRYIICKRNKPLFKYIIRRMARTVQYPGEQGRTALVFRGGEEGAGNGIFCNTFCSLFGTHAFDAPSSERIVGRFNEHLQATVVLYADEAFFAGDVKQAATLKKIITETTLKIEGKFKAVVEAQNFTIS